MTARLWSPRGDCHIGLRSGHTFVVPGDEQGIEVPQRFRREALARGCITVGSGAEESEPTAGVATAARGAIGRARGTGKAADGPEHLPAASRAPCVDSEAPVGSEATVEARASDHIAEMALGDPVATKIALMLNRAGGDGISRTRIRDLHHRHESADRIRQALTLLERRGLARVEHLATGGRRREVWYGAGASATEATEE